MGESKFGKYVLFGALLGAAVSFFDRHTREQVSRKSNAILSEIGFYSKNPDILKWKLREKKEKYQSVYDQLTEDVTYIKQQVEELKTLTPQVKELVVNTKDAFVESKDEYKSIVNETAEPQDSETKK